MTLLLLGCALAPPTPAPSPEALVEVAWAGTDAATMEQLVALPIEAAVVGLPDVAGIRSVSTPGLVQVTLTYTPDTVAVNALAPLTLQLQDTDLPAGTELPVVRLVQPPERAGVTLELGAQSPGALVQGWDVVSDGLGQCAAVSGAAPTMELAPTVRVEVDRQAAAALGVSTQQIAASAAGIDDPALLQDVMVTGPRGERIPLTAVASIHLEQAPVHLGRVNGQPATWFALTASSAAAVQECAAAWSLPMGVWVSVY